MGSREQAEEIVKTILLDAGCDFMAEDSVKFVAQKIAAKDAEIDRLNLAHAHATAASARRVRELEEALKVASTMCVKCFGRGTYSTGCPCIDDPRWEPDYHNCGAYDAECDDSTCVKVRAALAGKERSDGAN